MLEGLETKYTSLIGILAMLAPPSLSLSLSRFAQTCLETKYTSLIGNLGTLATLAPPALPPSLPPSFPPLSLSLSLSLARSLARSLCTSLLGGEVHLVDWNVQLYELLNRMSFSQHLTTLDLRLNQQLGAAQSLQFGRMKPFSNRGQAIVRFVDSPSLTPPVARSLTILPPLGEACVCNPWNHRDPFGLF